MFVKMTTYLQMLTLSLRRFSFHSTFNIRSRIFGSVWIFFFKFAFKKGNNPREDYL